MDGTPTNDSVCDLADACGVCNALEYPNDCWYLTKRLTGTKAPPIVEAFLSKFPYGDPPKLAQHLELLRSQAESSTRNLAMKSPAESFPSRYIPEIRPIGRDFEVGVKVLSRSGHPIIAVSLERFYDGIRETAVLRSAKRVGLHKYFQYDGQILLTTDVRDRLCDFFLNKPDYFTNLVNSLQPDYVTTFDASTYSNLPTFIAEEGICRVQNAMDYYNQIHSKVVGLVLGSNSYQILQFSRRLVKSGIKLLAFPAYELRRQRMDDVLNLRLRILHHYLKVPVLVLSCSANPSRRTIQAEYYSSLSWFPFSHRGDLIREGVLKLRQKVINARSVSEQKSLEELWGEVL